MNWIIVHQANHINWPATDRWSTYVRSIELTISTCNVAIRWTATTYDTDRASSGIVDQLQVVATMHDRASPGPARPPP